MASQPSSRERVFNAVMGFRSMRAAGVDNLSFNSGIRSVPPAR